MLVYEIFHTVMFYKIDMITVLVDLRAYGRGARMIRSSPACSCRIYGYMHGHVHQPMSDGAMLGFQPAI